MNYKQLDDRKKAQIDALMENGYSMREVGRRLGISHSTVSRYKGQVYKKREINIKTKYQAFITYLYQNYNWKNKGVEVCVHQFKRYHPGKASVSYQQVYNWINKGIIDIRVQDTCYKRSKRKKRAQGMMRHVKWNMENKTVLPIRLRPKEIEKRAEIGHLEIDLIIGKKNEYPAIITIVDRCTRVINLVKAESRYSYHIDKKILDYIREKEIVVKSITVDNGLEFQTLGKVGKRLGVKIYKCDPYCSFQRGTNEKLNSIVRRYIAKGRSLYTVEQQYLEDISFKINSMPRKMFDFKTPFAIEYKQLRSGALEI
jgi:Transposase and inactivated derivatives, IS30 family